jgi:hypothetical protein
MTRGTVALINPRRGFVAVDCGDGDYTVIELLGDDDVQLEDELSGDLNALGEETFANLRTGARIGAFVQAIQASRQIAIELLR